MKRRFSYFHFGNNYRRREKLPEAVRIGQFSLCAELQQAEVVVVLPERKKYQCIFLDSWQRCQSTIHILNYYLNDYPAVR